MHLSKRLTLTAECVTKGNVVADIGCDHAYTSIYLMKEGIAGHIIAADVNDGPIERARANINENRLNDFIEVRKSDGLTEFDISDGIETILISGMGGNLMIDRLKSNNAVYNNAKELILQPQSDIARVRHFLHDTGFKIVYEKMVYDEEKYYTIIKACHGKEQYSYEYEYIFGQYLINNPDNVCINYMKGLHASNVKVIAHLRNMDEEALSARINELEKDNDVIEMLLMHMQKEEGL